MTDKEKDLMLFNSALDAVESGKNVGVFLKEAKLKNDKQLGMLDLNTRITNKANVQLLFTPEYIHLYLEFEYERDVDILAIGNMYSEYLKRSTNRIRNNIKDSEYYLVFEPMGITNDITYSFTLVNPVFLFKDGNVLKIVFTADSVSYRSLDIDYSEVDEEIEYENKAREEELFKEELNKLSDEEKEYVKEQMEAFGEDALVMDKHISIQEETE